MNDPRKKHVGKSRHEKDAYQRMIRTQQVEDPTFDDYENTSTNSVVKDEPDKSALTELHLKHYERKSPIPWKEIVAGAVITVFSIVLFLFGMSLNREIGVLQERVDNIRKENENLSKDIDNLKKDIDDLKVDLKVLIMTNSGSSPKQ